MQLKCHCKYIITDSSDNLPFKASFLADEDWYSVFDAIASSLPSEHLASTVGEEKTNAPIACVKWNLQNSILDYLRRKIYRCNNCGRLWVEGNNHQFYSFVPENEAVSKTDLLRSKESE